MWPFCPGLLSMRACGRWRRRRACENLREARIRTAQRPMQDKILAMLDWNDFHTWLIAAAHSVGAEITSPWFYLQLGLIMAATGLALAAGAAIRAKVDLTSLMMGWPAPLRLFMRVLVGS